MKLLIIDDHKLFNDGLKSLLKEDLYFEKINQIYDSREVLNYLQLNPTDVIILDFNMPHTNGLKMTELILKNFPNQKIIILSMYIDNSQIEQFKKLGVKGYLIKTVDISEVINAIKAVHKNGTYFPTTTKGNNHSEDNFLRKFRLTKRELEVIKLIKEGKSTNEMADILSVSIHTIITHRKNVHLKLNVQNEREVIKFAIENGI